jgi:hypothetical protein
MDGSAEDHLTIEAVDGVRARPDGFQMTLKLNHEPDDLLRDVIQSWPPGSPGLTELQIVRDHLVVTTELDADAPARAAAWLWAGSDPALLAMQSHADSLRSAEREALGKVQQVFGAPG